MSKFTEGPWIVRKVPTSIGVCYRVGPQTIVENSYGGICLYDDRTTLNPHAEGEQEANANLAAAAPDMYKALVALFNLLEMHEPEWYLQAHYKIAKAALAKAEGRKESE